MADSSDDDMPLVGRAKPKATTTAPVVKDEVTVKPAAPIKGEVKAEVKEEGAKGSKAPLAKDKPAAKAKEEVRAPAAKGKAAAASKDDAGEQDGKAAAGGKKAAVKSEPKQPREKKEYDMPGQTRDPPPETDSLRKFYTSLLEQRPDSEMAKKWCLTHGLLSRKAAEELVAQLKKIKPSSVKSPVKGKAEGKAGNAKAAATTTRRPAERAPAAKKQRQAASPSPPPKKQRPTYSDEEDEASSDSSGDEADDDEDDVPLAKTKAAAGGAAAKKPAAGAAQAAGGAAAKKPAGAAANGSEAAAGPKKRPKGQDQAFKDGGLGYSDDSDDDDMPLAIRAKKD